MVTIDQIDFSKLKPYAGAVTQSFEQLCYQLAKREFGHLGSFTEIDGSGGDGGVEFYLKFTNGDEWGWQCKFYGDNGRLNNSGRASSIEESLKTACRNHTKLTKWFLCLKTDLTEESLSAKGKFSEGERTWFEHELPKSVPKDRTVELETWGETTILSFLNSEKHYGIRSFFFGELEFNTEWFKRLFDQTFEEVRDKYDDEVHTLGRYEKSLVDCLLLNSDYLNEVELLKTSLDDKLEEFNQKSEDFLGYWNRDKESHELKKKYLASYSFVFDYVAHTKSLCLEIKNAFDLRQVNRLDNIKFQSYQEDYFSNLRTVDSSVFPDDSTQQRDAMGVYYAARDLGETISNFQHNYFHGGLHVLHVQGEAAMGKTHLAADIAFKQIMSGKPAIFLTGSAFSNESSITETVLKIADVPRTYSIDDFLNALNVYADITKSCVPIVIDGLNETRFEIPFSSIWRNHLKSFSIKLKQYSNIRLLTTCRPSYVERIWGLPDTQPYFLNLSGFDTEETAEAAVSKYFSKYKLCTELYFADLARFENPLFLKIYCEVKNPNWKLNKEVEVDIEEETAVEIFNAYILQVNNRIALTRNDIRRGDNFVQKELRKLALLMWKNKTRHIRVTQFYSLIDGDGGYNKDTSKAEILINEGLVFKRDFMRDEEFVSFTYDQIAGCIIADELVSTSSSGGFVNTSSFVESIVQGENQHPLYDDVLDFVSVLVPRKYGVSLYDIAKRQWQYQVTSNKWFGNLPVWLKKKFDIRVRYFSILYSESINAIFRLPPNHIHANDIELVKFVFDRNDRNKSSLYEKLLRRVGNTKHPMNGEFLSNLLKELPMNIRDITWTEFVRQRAYDLEKFIGKFENECKTGSGSSHLITTQQHLIASIIRWFLTSTNRYLRNLSTRALYYYGKQYPSDLLKLTIDSLSVNDPYVGERCLAALYGAVLANQHSLSSETSNQIAFELFEAMFKLGAPHSTTHILSRDYARRSIEVCMKVNGSVLTEEDLVRIRPPYSDGGIRNWGESQYGNNEALDYSWSGPIHMDFSNYTIGRIVENGHSYSNPPEKVKVRRQIYWRIFQLGWEEKLFEAAEKGVGSGYAYNGRTERAKVERYGKKYSWIAFYEVAGYRKDLGLLEEDGWEPFRFTDSDIDPTFPEPVRNKEFVTENWLGDKTEPLNDWYRRTDVPDIDNYLKHRGLHEEGDEWICLEGFITQQDISINRQLFMFIHGFIVDEKDRDLLVQGLQDGKSREDLPEISKHYYTFADEMHTWSDMTYDNVRTIEVMTGEKEKTVDQNDPKFMNILLKEIRFGDLEYEPGKIPDSITITETLTEKVEVLKPVCGYSWESSRNSFNEAGAWILSKEILYPLNLKGKSQTFDLFDSEGNQCTTYIQYEKDYHNHHQLLYLRKDLLDQYLSENKKKLIWQVWGEREVKFATDDENKVFYTKYPFIDYQKFRRTVVYDAIYDHK